MTKFFVFLLLVVSLFQVPTKAQGQMLLPQDVEVIKYEEVGGHVFAVAKLRGNDSCTYFLLNRVSEDFIIITGVCVGDEAMSRFISDEDLGILLQEDTEARQKQKNPEKPDLKSEKNPF